MSPVVMLCPDTLVPVRTGFLFFNGTQLEDVVGDRFFRCSVCNRVHSWDKTTAWLGTSSAAAKTPRSSYVFKRDGALGVA